MHATNGNYVTNHPISYMAPLNCVAIYLTKKITNKITKMFKVKCQSLSLTV